MADQVSFQVQAGPHTRRNCLAWIDTASLFPDAAELDTITVTDEASGEAVPAQVCPRGDGYVLALLVDELPAGQSRKYRAAPGGSSAPVAVETKHTPGEQVQFLLDGELFTSYYFKAGIARPYLYPVIGPGGVEVTRDMTDLESKDHIHHRSIWIAQGEVNGFDNWSEMEGHASTVNRELHITVPAGPLLAEILSVSDWISPKDTRILEERTRIRVCATPASHRIIDVSTTWAAKYCGVHFGSTKEAGTLSVRVATSMEVRNGGKIENSYGGVGEDETWGRRAAWCDYSGESAGEHVGVAVMDHPDNFRFPTWWHVRNYGLMTANHWGLSDFTGDQAKRGDYALAKGQELSWDFRVYIHEADATAGSVAQKYHDFINPPKVSVGS